MILRLTAHFKWMIFFISLQLCRKCEHLNICRMIIMADKVVLKQTSSVCEEVKEVKRGF